MTRLRETSSQGYAAIALDRVKCTANLGGVLRAASVFGASLVMVSGGRLGRYATDTTRAYKHIPSLQVDDIWQNVPFGATPVVIEVHYRARSLTSFTHPESAFYIFGPKDGSVRKEIVERVPLIVQIPAGCLNLAAAVNVVLYDRLAKSSRK